MFRIPRSLAAAAAGVAILLGTAAGLKAQPPASPQSADIEALKKTAPRVFLDCSSCDIEFIKTEVTFVNYVRDRNEAQVHILVTSSQTASGGREYTLTFMGQNEFKGLDDTVHYYSSATFTEDEVRKGLVRTLKLGLMTYVVRTPIASRITLRDEGPPAGPAAGPDRWRSWVFSLSGHGYFQGESSVGSSSWNMNVSANKITADVKLRLGLSADFNRNRYEYEGVTYRSRRESYDFNGLFVKAIDDHWSVGFALDANSSLYSNLKLRIAPAPAVEFNVFPYSKYARRQLRLLYKLRFEAVSYHEETIYFKTRESLFSESLSATLDLKEKWGSISLVTEGSHYFHDFSKYSLSVFGVVQLNLVKGFNVYAGGGGGRTHDQLSLRAGGATLQEVLLRQRQLASSYSYFALFGLSYTFGSIYTNVVNPRFGSIGGGGMSITID